MQRVADTLIKEKKNKHKNVSTNLLIRYLFGLKKCFLAKKWGFFSSKWVLFFVFFFFKNRTHEISSGMQI